ncbi:hypothetical protein GCM10009759_31590 [Kitasatospora saccharophila]|uniref:FAD dependent oxidoreductase n=1 Tax=Kitasatospora saccharophila TaxID=407973 RepID=A0ABN2WXV4_9ACTN
MRGGGGWRSRRVGCGAGVSGCYGACGHGGAGIGLASATGLLIGWQLAGVELEFDLAPFRPERFVGAGEGS